LRVLTYTSLFPSREKPVQGIFIFQRISHLAQRPGVEVQVIAPVPYFPSWLRATGWQKEGQTPRKEQIGNLAVHHPRYLLLPKISMPFHGMLMFLGTFLSAARLHRESPFDCIDAHFIYPDCFAAVLLAKLLKLPVIVSARGTDINLYPSFKIIKPMIGWTLRNSAGAIAVSSSLRDVMLEFGLAPESVCVIGNGIDVSRFNPVDPLQARAQLQIPLDAQVAVSVGGLVPRKGFHFLIPAVAAIASRHPKLRLYIIGEGEERSRLESLIRECGLQDRSVLVGSVPNEQLRLWYSAADVSCLVSAREGWANVLQESMACGTPVIATRVWGAPEIVVSPDLGILVDQNSPAISAALESALATHWNRQAIAHHAHQRTWQTVAAEVEQFLSFRIHPSRSGHA
jgi:teichuronic acid biosynthesis glycosyltransferase TuaC